MALLEVRGLSKAFAYGTRIPGRAPRLTHAVRDVSFDLDANETVAIVGESGAGKSTVGRLVLRLIEPSAGEVVFDGTPVSTLGRRELRSLRRRMQMIFQDPYSSLDPRVSVGDSIAEPMLVHDHAGKSERQARTIELLERVGLGSAHAQRYPGELSGGQLQRVAIARALSVKPALIVCDEPTSALDVSVQAQVINLMKEIQQEFGLSYLFISHDLSLVQATADRICVMRDGVLVEQGSVTEIFDHPTSDYTRSLIAAIPSGRPRRSPADASTAKGVASPRRAPSASSA